MRSLRDPLHMEGTAAGLWARLREFRGFITIPGILSLAGLVLAFATLSLDGIADHHFPETALEPLAISPPAARAVLMAVAGSAMTALSLVYSTVLVVFTLAAGNIGPRLLQRFNQDRISQVAVGTLGATFLYSLFVLRSIGDGPVPELALTVGLALAAASLVMLLIFVNAAARRVTIDEEIAAIGRTLDRELAAAVRGSDQLAGEDLIRPSGPARNLLSPNHGYVKQIALTKVAEAASRYRSYVDFRVAPGDYVIRGQPLAVIVGVRNDVFDHDLSKLVLLGPTRTPSGDLRFSINLLVEIGLRALSPGIDDTFTAVACVDRLSSALLRARIEGLATGIYTDAAGVPRVTAPNLGVDDLIRAGFQPLRHAARSNPLMTERVVMALGRLGCGVGLPGEDAVREQLNLMREENRRSDILKADKNRLETLIDSVLKDQVGRTLDR